MSQLSDAVLNGSAGTIDESIVRTLAKEVQRLELDTRATGDILEDLLYGTTTNENRCIEGNLCLANELAQEDRGRREWKERIQRRLARLYDIIDQEELPDLEVCVAALCSEVREA